MAQKKKRTKTKVAAPRPKITTFTILGVACVTVVILLLSIYLGTILEYSQDTAGKIDYTYFPKASNLIAQHPNWILTALGKSNGRVKQTITYAMLVWGIFLLYKYSQDTRRTHRKGVEHGSAKWGDRKEMSELADKGDGPEEIALKDADGNLIFDDRGNFVCAIVDNNLVLSEDVLLSLNSKQHLLNLNVLIIGGSGSGKTRFYAIPNILQLSTSYIITDPKGEILQNTGTMLEQSGYKVRVLNLIEMNHSHNYNPFHYVYDYNGDLSEDYIKKMVDVLFKATRGEGEQQDFWAQKGQSMLEAIVYLLFEESEYNAEIDQKSGKIIPETRDLSHLNFFSVTEKMRRLQYPPRGSKKPDGFFLTKLAGETEEEFRLRQEEGFLCPLDRDFIELEKRKGETLAGRLYKEVRNAPEETGQSFLSSANVKTFFFNLTNLSNLTCCDNIHLEKLGDEKTALFLIIPATNSTYNFVVSMLYTQMFDVLANRANFKFGGTLPVHVRCIMDEFANIGEIPDFDKVIAFVRSMGISLNVILQNLAQLKSRYEKTWESITGNCDTLLFLGGQEETTLKYLSEGLGKETIDVRAVNKTMSTKNPSSSESNSIMGRELMMPNELSTMPISDCIVKIRAHNPFYCSKYPLDDHPNYKFLAMANPEQTYHVSKVKSVTAEEYISQFEKNNKINRQKTSEKSVNLDTGKPETEKGVNLDTGKSDSEKEKLSAAETAKALWTNGANLVHEEEIHYDSDRYDSDQYDEEDYDFGDIPGGEVSEEYIYGSNQYYGDATEEFESFDLGEPNKEEKEEDLEDTDDEEKVHYAENVSDPKEELELSAEQFAEAANEIISVVAGSFDVEDDYSASFENGF